MKEPSILVFSAHAADFCTRAGGTLALYRRRGAAVHVVDATYGERGESEDYWARPGAKSVEEAKRVREEEAREAAGILDVTIEFLDYGDYPLVLGRERLEALARVVRSRKPDILLTHWKSDPFDVDHQVLAEGVLHAANLATVAGFDHETGKVRWPYMFAFEPSIPNDDATGFRPDHFVDIDEVFDLKMKAVAVLRSQSKLVRYYTQWGEHRGFQARLASGRQVRCAEAYQRFTPVVDTRLPEGVRD
jgi:4-oxalomesaconate hydratase